MEALENLIQSLYAFVKEEADYTRSEFKRIDTRLEQLNSKIDAVENRLTARLIKIENKTGGQLTGHEARISRLETRPA